MTLRRRYLFLALAGGALVAAGAVPWPADNLPFRHDLAEQVEAGLGLEVRAGESTIALLPLPRIDFHDVTLSAAGAAGEKLGSARLVSVRLALWPLLSGRAQARQVTVDSPRMTWEGSQRPHDLWLLARDRLMAAVTIAGAGDARLPAQLTVIDGTVVADGGTRTLLRRLNGSVTWPSARRPLDFQATALWRGEAVSLRIDKLHPASLAAGMASPVVVRFSAQPVSFSFAGAVEADDLPTLDGLINLRTGSLARATAWMRTPLTFAQNIGQMSVKSAARLTADGLSLPSARIEIESGTLEGALAVRYGDTGRALVSATLDAASLDLNRFLPSLGPQEAGRGTPRALHLDAGSGESAANDVDVRLSISKAQAGPLALQDVAAGILVSGKQMEFALNQARLDSGSLRAKLQLASEGKESSARLHGVFEGVEAQKPLQDIFGSALFAGPASGSFSLAAGTRSGIVLPETIAGNVSVHIEGGQMLGVDLADVLDRSRRSPLATALDWRGGRTLFSRATVNLVISGGGGQVEGALAAEGIDGVLAGGIDIVQRMLDLKAQIRKAAPKPASGAAETAPDTDTVGFPIEISGSWDYPIVTPDIRLLIERSSAVAPLLPDNTRNAPVFEVR